MNTLKIDLTRFCAVGSERAHLNAPWVYKGRTIATNGYILISVDYVSDLAAARVPDHQKIEVGISKMRAETSSYVDRTIIDVDALPTSRCLKCNGSGFVFCTKCDDCDGKGEFWHANHEYVCKQCDGVGCSIELASAAQTGAEKCMDCNGLGEGLSRFSLGAATFPAKHLRLIGNLPKAEVYLGPHSNQTARFEFDGGYGFVMPIRI